MSGDEFVGPLDANVEVEREMCTAAGEMHGRQCAPLGTSSRSPSRQRRASLPMIPHRRPRTISSFRRDLIRSASCSSLTAPGVAARAPSCMKVRILSRSSNPRGRAAGSSPLIPAPVNTADRAATDVIYIKSCMVTRVHGPRGLPTNDSRSGWDAKCSAVSDGCSRQNHSVDEKAGEDWVSAQNPAEVLGLQFRTIYALIDRGELRAEVSVPAGPKRRRTVRLRRQDVREYLDRARVKPGELSHLYPPATGPCLEKG